MAKVLYTPQELCDAIYSAVLKADKPISRLEICRTIERKKSAHIVRMIASLAAGGWLIETASIDKHRRNLFVYTVGQIASPPDCAEVA